MEILSYTSTKTAIFITLILIGYAIYIEFRSKKMIALFLISILGASIFVLMTHVTTPAATTMTLEQKNQFLQQQHTFIDWYTNYKKDIDTMDSNWQQYDKILQSFKNDDISIQTVYLRLTQLQEQSLALKNKFLQQKPPESLEDTNYTLTAKIIEKTSNYITMQTDVITKSKSAVDPSNLKTKNHDEQVQILERIMTIGAPTPLTIADEVSVLKENLTLPDEK